ncbi:SGNH/GDSL hydrolase family protein [Rhodococcus sp. T2V]|uniref:SGNH/GDSL hydrolase family protein n=1 Tax=Rhodococcus sp. T2V TaxID=3034164 RepID=UPI0023E1E61E|nr:SGNH/GDSL hydrolase family protein [Rhodococcus sp. T2V]MDF3303410.1 SGNH/GDSL hydrolase family protein [Rhodococcus sp. T2V]
MSRLTDKAWIVAGILSISAALILVGAGIIVSTTRSETDYTSHYTTPPSADSINAVQVAVIGDSYTSGTEVGGFGSSGWPALLENRLYTTEHPVLVAVSGRPGSGYANPGAGNKTFGQDLESIISADTDVVVMFGSRTDANMRIQESAGATYAAIRRIAPTAAIIVIAPAWINEDVPERIIRLRDELKPAAMAAGAVFVDPIGEGWFFGKNSSLIGEDEIHPTNEGHKYMANLIEPRLRDALQLASHAR